MKRDVVIVGGGVMGAATAYFLKRLEPSISIAVIERDHTYRRSSTLLSEGNVRIQFNLEENILMSQFAFEALETFADDMAVGHWRPGVSAKHQGNLFLVDMEGRAPALEGMELQLSLGCDVEWLDESEVRRRWPVYSDTGLVGGTFGRRDGSVDPSAVLEGYRRKAISLGAEFIDAEVESIMKDGEAVAGVTTTGGEGVQAPIVLNAAGAWARDVALTVGVDIPVRPVMRSVFLAETTVECEGLPSVFAPSGVYVLPEAGTSFLMAWSQPDDPVGYDFVVRRQRFYDLVWPEVIRYFPVFDALDIASSWAGLYAVNTLDGNAILGEWPELRGFFLANGFSGHGFQQCHAVGRYLAETMLERDLTLDLRRLGPQRVLDGSPLFEHAGRII